MSKNKWKTLEFSSSQVSKSCHVSRNLWVDNKTTPKYKYLEKVSFNGANDKKYAICIGLNPAKAEINLDETNKRLVRLLKKEYCGYYLFNIYPEITDNATQINLEDKENISFVSELKDILKEEIYKDLDVILFFGRTLIIPNEFVELIRQWIDDKKKIYLTSHNGEFMHPGANASIELQEFKKEYLQKETVIRIKKRERAWQK